MRQDLDAVIAEEWRALGFWYDFTPNDGWVLHGSVHGLSRLAEALDKYAADSRHEEISEHEHIGPHMYLKLVTWHQPEVNKDGIYGLLSDLKNFAASIRNSLAAASPGDRLELAQGFSAGSTVGFTMVVEDNSFDPASLDTQWKPS